MTTLQKTAAKGPGGAARLLRYLAMPIFLGLAGLALYVYVGIHGLDSIEQRSLNAGTLIGQTARLIELAAVSTAIVVTLSVTTGILLTRPFARHVSPFVIGLANIGQAVPSIGVLAFLSILRNTMVGLRQVDRSVIEAARGMGMTKMAVLFRIELPLAVPIILAGIRTALIINVGTATLAAFVDAGGLGTVIDRGIRLGRDSVLIVGSVLT